MTPILEIRSLHRDFGGLVAVNDVSFSVQQGEVFGVIGPNGAGKTTLFNMITGITPASSGRVVHEGETVSGLPPHRIARRGIGRTFQNIRLFRELSILDNIKIGMHLHTRTSLMSGILGSPGSRREERNVDAKAREILALVGLRGRVDTAAGALSYGEQRRLEVGRALALRPKILLLDEPAAGMNAAEKQTLTSFIRDIRDRFDLTVLLIEHHVPLVMNLCDRIAVLDFGELIALGRPAEVQKDPAVIEAYLGQE